MTDRAAFEALATTLPLLPKKFVPETNAQLLQRVARLRQFPENTCPASRHAQIIGKALIKKRPYPMLAEEPEHCGRSILSTVASLYAARTRIAALESECAAIRSRGTR